MGTLTIRIVRQPGGEAVDTLARPLVPAGMSIGRSPECELVLDDPLRLVSRRHAWLVPIERDKAVIHCVSASASLTVNGATLPSGSECQVEEGDRVCIGAFELEIGLQRPAEVALLELARRVSPRPPPQPAEPAEPAAAAPAAIAAPAAAPASAPAAAPAVAARRQAPASRLAQWFDLDTAADPLAPESPLSMPAAAARTALPPRMAAASAPLPPPPPPPVASPPPAPPVQAAAPARAKDPAPDHAALREAFLRGAGLDDGALPALDPPWAEHLGTLLRGMTDGTFDLLRSRAVTKQGIRAQSTQIVARENNPLKFAPDATECLRLLLQPQPRPGFLAPVDALHDVHRDLQVHQLALMAGMRAAVSELILQLGPEAIEQTAGPARGWMRWFPGAREADLWRRHRDHHAELVSHLDDALEAAFGREFLLAYEAQSRHAARHPDGSQPSGPDRLLR